MIISASRRTDIPAFYPEWFMGRVRAGSCRVANPFNRNCIRSVPLEADDVDAIVFWTKNPAPLMRHLDELDAAGMPYCFLYTVNDYPGYLEPYIPSIGDRVESFLRLSERLGAGRVVWRYDPIILSRHLDVAWHLATFERLAGALEGRTERVIVSLLDIYRKTARRLRDLASASGQDFIDPLEHPDLPKLAAGLLRSTKRHGLQLQSCAEPPTLARLGIPAGGCIDAEYLSAVLDRTIKVGRHRGQRDLCLCSRSVDIGAPNTCIAGCEYCYATTSHEVAARRHAAHSPECDMLCPSRPFE